MTLDETKTILRYLQNSINYLEYGGGSSTVMASKILSIKKIFTVESSQSFIKETLLNKPEIQKALKSLRLVIQNIDIGETTKWGFPKNVDKIELWPNYSKYYRFIKTIFVYFYYNISKIFPFYVYKPGNSL